MFLTSIKLPIIKKNDPFLRILVNQLKENGKNLQEKDILVISEKVISISQGRVVDLAKINQISEKAQKLAKKYNMDPKIVELILQEASEVIGGMEHVILTKVNNFLIANAGIDQSNAGLGKVVLLPENLDEIIWKYRKKLKNEFDLTDLGIIIADSRVQPLRKGTIGIAIATAGFEPVEDCVGKPDLFGRPLEITLRAVADDLVSAAQFLLGEANEQTPVVLIRGAKVTFTENPKTTPDMPPEKCLYMNIFSKYLIQKEKSFQE